jgi:cyclophilin family peptidyl-prolyl cis-trans isomerase
MREFRHQQGEAMISMRSLWAFAALALTAHFALAADKNPVVVIETSAGTIKVELLADKAPVTVKNFLGYVDDKFYDGTIFHRVIPNFMIQGGGMEPGMKEKTTKAPIINEASNGLANDRGTIAMARLRDPNSATAQFYINLKDNPGLNKERDPHGFGYCVFGKVIDGMDVVDKIAQAQTANRGQHEAVPVEDIVIKSIRKE